MSCRPCPVSPDPDLSAPDPIPPSDGALECGCAGACCTADVSPALAEFDAIGAENHAPFAMPQEASEPLPAGDDLAPVLDPSLQAGPIPPRAAGYAPPPYLVPPRVPSGPDPFLAPEDIEAILIAAIEGVQADLLRLWGPPPSPCVEVGVGGLIGEDFFGDGSDGDVVISGDQEVLRDYFPNTLTIGANSSFTCRGCLRVKGKLTIAATGLLHANGADGTAAVGSAQGSGGVAAQGGVRIPWWISARQGGNGGGPGGTGTTGSTPGAAATGQAAFLASAPILFQGGCSGGGGAYLGQASGAIEAQAGAASYGPAGGAGGAAVSDASSVALGGGGGGGGGGVLMLFAHEIDNAGAIRADGGDGGSGAVSGANKGGAGGGGGGGAVIAYYTVASGSGLGTVSADGGAAGTAGGAAGAGAAGVVRTYQVNV